MAEESGVQHLARTHGFTSDNALWTLFETVREFATRDHKEGKTKGGFIVDRADAFESAKNIISLATAVQGSLAALRLAIEDFGRDFDYDPVLMEAIFELDVGPPGRVTLAPELDFLANFPNGPMWGHVNGQLDGIRKLPVRRGLPRGRVAPRTLQKCVDACRSFWESHDRTWKLEALADELVRADDKAELLTGKCERLVCDVLRAAGMPHTLEELGAAMQKRATQCF